MCIGDWRLGRLIRSEISFFNISSGINITKQRNPQRVGLTVGVIEAPFANTAFIQLMVDDIDFTILPFNRPIFHCTLQTHGDLPTRKFDVGMGSSVVQGAWIEYFMPEEYIQAALEDFRRQYGIRG